MQLRKILLTLFSITALCTSAYAQHDDELTEFFFRIRGGVSVYTHPSEASFTEGSIATGYCTDEAVGIQSSLSGGFYFQALLNFNYSRTSSSEKTKYTDSFMSNIDARFTYIHLTGILDANVGKYIYVGGKNNAIDIAAGAWVGWLLGGSTDIEGTTTTYFNGTSFTRPMSGKGPIVVGRKGPALGLGFQAGYAFHIAGKKTVLSLAARIPLSDLYAVPEYNNNPLYQQYTKNMITNYSVGFAIYPFRHFGR